MTTDRPASGDELDGYAQRLDDWLAVQLAENPTVTGVEREDDGSVRRWVARVEGEEKANFAIWFQLRQRSLHVETYVLPAPEENVAQTYEYLLRRNQKLHGFRFAIGAEDAVFLIGEIPVEWIDDDELDRLFGSTYAYVEQSFRPAMRLAFASRFGG
jgi:hypothetical protein